MRKIFFVLFPQFVGSFNTALIGPIIFSQFSFFLSFIIIFSISTFISYLLIKVYDKNKKDIFEWEYLKKKQNINVSLLYFVLIVIYNPTIAVIRYRPGHYQYNGMPNFNTKAIFCISCVASGIIGTFSSDVIFLFFKKVTEIFI